MSNLPEWYMEPTDQEEQDRKEEKLEEQANAYCDENEPETI